MTSIARKSKARSATRPRESSRQTLDVMPWVVLAVVAIVAIWAYWPAMTGAMLWDDEAHVTRPGLRSLSGLGRIWFLFGATQQYYPLLHSSFWVQHHLWGDDSFGYHVVNLFLHLATVALVYLVLRKLRIPGALLAAAIFALHPVHVETVAWITEQKNTLSAVFYLGAMLAYLYFDENRRGSWYALALGLFLLGLLSKTTTATLPAALLVIFWWTRGTLFWRRDVVPLIPFFVLGAIGGLFTAWFEHALIGANGDEFNLSLVARCLLAGRVIWFYLAKLVWPAHLVFFYERWEVNPAEWWQWTFSLAATVVTVALWWFRNRWRAPLAAWLFFIGTLFPVLGFLNVYPFRFSFVADHFQYLASLGPIALVSAGIALGVQRLPREGRVVAVLSLTLVLGGYAWLTRQQTGMYEDALTLYRTTTERNPRSWVAFNNLGATLMSAGRHQEALEPLNRALELKPDYVDALNNFGKARVAITGNAREAIDYFEKARQIKPQAAEAYNNLGNALLNSARQQEAIAPLEEALKLSPNYADAHLNLGVVLFQLNRPQEALAELGQAVALRPDMPETVGNFGAVLLSMDRREEALPFLLEAVRINPNYMLAWVNLTMAYWGEGRTADAIIAAQKARDIARATGASGMAQQMEKVISEMQGGP